MVQAIRRCAGSLLADQDGGVAHWLRRRFIFGVGCHSTLDARVARLEL